MWANWKVIQFSIMVKPCVLQSWDPLKMTFCTPITKDKQYSDYIRFIGTDNKGTLKLNSHNSTPRQYRSTATERLQ